MALLVGILIMLILGLGLFQAWQLWYTRREIARLEQRLAESLDDQDLLEFQDRLKGLLVETKDAGLSLVQSIERRQEAVEKVIAKAVDAEKRLSVRAQLLELAAKELSKPPVNRAKPLVAKAKAIPAKKTIVAAEIKTPSIDLTPAKSEIDNNSRSYLSRPVSPAAPDAGPTRYQRVYELADQGLSREQIAKEAGMLPGEVELILNLRPGKRRSK